MTTETKACDYLKDDSEYMYFQEIPHATRKTRTVGVYSRKNGHKLGQIYWWGPWRQYIFEAHGALFNRSCMADIIEQIDGMMEERKTAPAD